MLSPASLLDIAGWILSPKRYVKGLAPGACECDIIGKRVFANIIKLWWGHPGVGWALIQWLAPLQEQIWIQRHRTLEAEEWSDVATSQGFLAITRSMPVTPLVLFILFNDRILSLWPRCPQLTLLETIFTSPGLTTFPPPASESLHSPTLQVTEKVGCFISYLSMSLPIHPAVFLILLLLTVVLCGQTPWQPRPSMPLPSPASPHPTLDLIASGLHSPNLHASSLSPGSPTFCPFLKGPDSRSMRKFSNRVDLSSVGAKSLQEAHVERRGLPWLHKVKLPPFLPFEAVL